MVSLENYKPNYISDTKDFIDAHREELKKLVGKTIQTYWVVWEENTNIWYSDGVIVLGIDGIRIEICNNKLDELSITWGEIDINSEAYDLDLGEYGRFSYTLREKSLERMNSVLGKTIKEIEIIEYEFETEQAFESSQSEKCRDRRLDVCLNGIGFKLDDGYFSVFNALDTNGITFERESKGLIYTSI